MITSRPQTDEYAPFYAGYVARASPRTTSWRCSRPRRPRSRRSPARESDAKADHRYAEGKWSVREVLGHVIDAERVFGYRAFCFSRGEQAPLPGFDEKQYVGEAPPDGASLPELAAEFAAVRDANLSFLRRLRGDAWRRVGTASGKPVSVRALAFILAGHPRHHLSVLRERYGIA